ncbi:MAG TPA: hypothetical protein VHB46_08650 [Burkholderiales bacterium]|nr:hypothetical protein [Burkholderiales bacterium]
MPQSEKAAQMGGFFICTNGFSGYIINSTRKPMGKMKKIGIIAARPMPIGTAFSSRIGNVNR